MNPDLAFVLGAAACLMVLVFVKAVLIGLRFVGRTLNRWLEVASGYEPRD
jgi:hypothetical protein